MDIQTDVFVELHVPDFDTALEFYSALDFELMWRRNEAKGYMVLQRGQSILNFYSGTEAVYDHSFFHKYSKTTPRGYGVEIVILVDDIETLYQKAKKLFPDSIVEELKVQPWGKKDFRLEDPFGFYVRFTERYDWVNKYPKGTVMNQGQNK